MIRLLLCCVLLLSQLLLKAQPTIADYFDYTTNDPIQIGLQAGEYFPKIQYLDINNKEIFFDDKNYQLTVVNFWFRGCTGCMQEIPFLRKVVAHYKDNPKIRFVSITPSDYEAVLKTNKKFGDTNFEVVSLGSHKRVKELFHFSGYPRQNLVDNNGKVLAQYINGIYTDDWLTEFIKRIDLFLTETSVSNRNSYDNNETRP